MNSKMTQTHNYQQMNLRKAMKTKTKQTTRTGTESEKWTSHGGFSVRKGREEQGEKGTVKKNHNWQACNRWGEVKNGIGKREFTELIRTTDGHEPKVGDAEGLWGAGLRGDKRGKFGKTVVA